jgi:hypothetical protein
LPLSAADSVIIFDKNAQLDNTASIGNRRLATGDWRLDRHPSTSDMTLGARRVAVLEGAGSGGGARKKGGAASLCSTNDDDDKDSRGAR